MARIYLDARAAGSTASGVGRYCDALVTELTRQAPQHEFIVLAGREVAARLQARGVLAADVGGSGSLGLALSRPQVSRAFHAHGVPDLFHALFHIVPFGLRRVSPPPTRIVVTLHDLIWIDYAEHVATSGLEAAWRRRVGSSLIPHALTTADWVICNSQATAAGAARWISRDRCTVVHMGVGADFLDAAPADMPPERTRPYVTAFGVAKAYKNIGCLVQAFARLRGEHPDLQLLLLGGDGGVHADIVRLGLENAVRVVTRPNDEDVRTLIRGAQLHVVPSLVEGFGLPVVEAMALGTPVVISDAAALLEVAGTAAVTFPATDATALASAMSGLLADAGLRRTLSLAGRERARQFTWTQTAAGTLAVYERVLATPTVKFP